MSRGGKRAGAGRPHGAKNKTTIKREQLVEDLGDTPIMIMLDEMRYHYDVAQNERKKGAKARPDIVCEALAMARSAAKDVAPYIHPKLQAVTLGGNPDDATPVPIRIDSLTNDQLGQLITRIESTLSSG